MKMKNIARLLCLATLPAFAQVAPAPVAVGSMIVGVGLNYNHYNAAAPAFSSAVDFGFRLGATSPFMSLSSLILEPHTASVQTAVGYDLRKSGPLHVILLASFGLTTTSTTNAAGTTTTTNVATAPVLTVGTLNLGTLGGGVLVRYDLGHWRKSLEGLGIAAGFRETAVSGSNVSPEFMLKLNYYLK